ncbi:MAG: stage 0 sporulation family protein [Desulfovibrionaceae bacterium]
MNIISVRFRACGHTSLCAAQEPFSEGERVMVETEHGLAMAEVARPSAEAAADSGDLPVVLRRATDEELAAGRANDELAAQARAFCKACIENRRLDMKLVDVEVFFDRSKLIFYFTAPARIDFRELVKDLVREYRSRIELRQIGVRHETQMVGAVGNCGMVCCCRRYLNKFAPVTIRMAKEQNLFLNPTKISGICGRLLCCLSYEQENYDSFHRSCPRLGKKYQTRQGAMKVLRANMFRNSISVLTESNEEQEYTLDEWKALEPFRPEAQPQPQQGGQQKQPRAGAATDGLLVFSASPDSLDDPFLFDGLLPPPEEELRQEESTPSSGEGEGAKRRRRRRKPRQDGGEPQGAREKNTHME